MNEGELIEFIYMAVGMGLVMQVYFPKILISLIPIVAIIGAFYLVWGILNKITAGFTSHGATRRDDWWNGLAILSLIALWFGAPNTAVAAVQWVLGTIYYVIVGFATIAL